MSNQHEDMREAADREFAQLGQAARVTGESRMITEGMDSSKVTEAIAQKVIDLVKNYRNLHNISLADIGHDIGYTSSVISQVLGMRYRGDWQNVICDLDRWLDARERQDAAPAGPEFVSTGVAEDIMTVAAMAAASRQIGLVIGPSGIGKSMALKAVAKAYAGSIYVSLTSSTSSPSGILKEICRAADLAPALNMGENALFNKVRHALLNSNRLLIVDEIHSILRTQQAKGFHTLRYLHDETRAPQVWSSTVDLINEFKKLEARETHQPFEQVRTRIIIARNLMAKTASPDGRGRGDLLFTIEDVRKLYGRRGMRLASDAAKFLLRLANLPRGGHARLCDALVRLTMQANKGADQITEAMLRDMLGNTTLLHDYQVMLAQVEDESTGLSMAM